MVGGLWAGGGDGDVNVVMMIGKNGLNYILLAGNFKENSKLVNVNR